MDHRDWLVLVCLPVFNLAFRVLPTLWHASGYYGMIGHTFQYHGILHVVAFVVVDCQLETRRKYRNRASVHASVHVHVPDANRQRLSQPTLQMKT